LLQRALRGSLLQRAFPPDAVVAANLFCCRCSSEPFEGRCSSEPCGGLRLQRAFPPDAVVAANLFVAAEQILAAPRHLDF